MDVRLPSGQIIRGVPDGMSRSDLRMKLLKNGINPDAPAPAVSPTDGMSGTQLAAAGLGKAAVDTGVGLKQIGMALADQIPGVDFSQERAALEGDVTESRNRDRPLMQTGAGMLGNVAGNVALALAPGGAVLRAGKAVGSARTVNAGRALINPATFKGAAAQGAVLSGVQPVAEDESRVFNAAAGGVLGATGLGVVRGAGKLVSGVGTSLNPQQAEVVRRAQAAGLGLTPGEVTGSRAIKIAEASLGSTPGGAAVYQRGAVATQQRVNEIAGEAIGRPGVKVITREVLDDVAEELGQKYDAVRAVKRIDLDKRFAVRLRQIMNDQTSRSEALQDAKTKELVLSYLDTAKGVGIIDGKRFIADVKALRKQAQDAFRAGNSDLGHAKKQLAEALEETAERSLKKQNLGNVLDDFRGARQKYSKLLTIESAHDEATGNVSAAKLGTALRRQSPKKFGTRGDDLETVGMYGQAFKPFQSSGTAERALLAGSLVGGSVLGDDPTDPLKAAGAAYAIPAAAALALNNPVARNYLLRGVPGLRQIPNNALSQALRPAAVIAPNALALTRD